MTQGTNTKLSVSARINQFLDRKHPMSTDISELTKQTVGKSTPRGRKIDVQYAPFIAL